jgi:hypothetical protein
MELAAPEGAAAAPERSQSARAPLCGPPTPPKPTPAALRARADSPRPAALAGPRALAEGGADADEPRTPRGAGVPPRACPGAPRAPPLLGVRTAGGAPPTARHARELPPWALL